MVLERFFVNFLADFQLVRHLVPSFLTIVWCWRMHGWVRPRKHNSCFYFLFAVEGQFGKDGLPCEKPATFAQIFKISGFLVWLAWIPSRLIRAFALGVVPRERPFFSTTYFFTTYFFTAFTPSAKYAGSLRRFCF